MKLLNKTGRAVADFIEVYLPIGAFILMFIVFLINIFARYVLRNSQNWTFEFSVCSFVLVGLLGACAAYRKEDHVVFDLVYNGLKPRGRAALRMVSHAVVILFFVIAIPLTVRYLVRLPSVTSIMKIPDRYVFLPFLILLVSTVARSAYRLLLDIRAWRERTYAQRYNTEDGSAST